MSDKKYVVPEGMLEAAVNAMKEPSGTKFRSTEQWATMGLEAAVRWLAENPIVPTHKQMREWCNGNHVHYNANFFPYVFQAISDWQRRCFLAPEPEVPDAVKELLWGDWQRHLGLPETYKGWAPLESHNAQVLEAYNRGKSGK